MRIGIDASPLSYEKTGVGNYLYFLLRPLLELRREDHFFLYAPSLSKDLEELNSFPHVTIREKPFLSSFLFLWGQTTLAWLSFQDHLDVFWAPTQSFPLMKRKKQKTVLTIHDFAYRLFPETVSQGRGVCQRVFGREFYSRAEACIVNSKGTGKRLQELYGITAEEVIIPPLKEKVRSSPSQALLKKWKLSPQAYLLSLGTSEPRKNMKELLEAYLTLLKKEDPTTLLPLVFVGKRGWRDTHIAKQLKIAVENYPHHVRHLGYLPDEEVEVLLSSARFFLMLSKYEGYGMPIAEARACQTPVIATPIPEMIEAAEGDLITVNEHNLAQELLPYFKKNTPQKTSSTPHYPSNQELATLLSTQIDKLNL